MISEDRRPIIIPTRRGPSKDDREMARVRMAALGIYIGVPLGIIVAIAYLVWRNT